MPGLPVAGPPAPLPPLPPLPPPAVTGPRIGSAGPVLAAWCANKRIRARIRAFAEIGINTPAKRFRRLGTRYGAYNGITENARYNSGRVFIAAGPLAGVYAVFILAAYKLPAGILAACAGQYGRKNTRGKFPGLFSLIF